MRWRDVAVALMLIAAVGAYLVLWWSGALTLRPRYDVVRYPLSVFRRLGSVIATTGNA